MSEMHSVDRELAAEAMVDAIWPDAEDRGLFNGIDDSILEEIRREWKRLAAAALSPSREDEGK